LLLFNVVLEGDSLANNEVFVTTRDIEKLADWMRRSGRPQTVSTLARRYIEMLREERGIRDTTPKSK
jgi:hypothetical protein